jgi:hypothetical protein
LHETEPVPSCFISLFARKGTRTIAVPCSLAQFATLEKKPTVILSNEVECDEAYVIAGHKGQSEVVKKKS